MLRHFRKRYSVVALMMLVIALNANARGEQPLAEMVHTAWTARDGAPQGIKALVQGPDGTLWVGSASGLYNFDGRTFAPFRSQAGEPELPIDSVSSLCVARDGTLWVGFFEAGVARIQGGRVTVYANAGEHRLRFIKYLRQADDGSIWASSAQAIVVRFGADQEWHVEANPDAVAGGRVFAVLDSFDVLWVSQQRRLYRRDIRETGYTQTNVAVDWLFGFAEAPDGTLWISDYDGAQNRSRLQHIDRLGGLIKEVPVSETADHSAYLAYGSVIYAPHF